MRIVLITAEYPPAAGGVADYTEHLAHILGTLGHTVTVITPPCLVPERRPTRRPAGVEVVAATGGWGLAGVRAVARQAAARIPDVIALQYVPTMYGRGGVAPAVALLPLLLRRATTARVAVTLHEVAVAWRLGPRPALQAAAHYLQLLLLAYGADRVVVTNARYAALVRRWTQGRVVPRVVPVGTNILPLATSRRQQAALRRALGVGEAPLVGSLSPLGVGDQPTHLVAVLQRLPTAHLALLGGLPRYSQQGPRFAALARRAGVAARVAYTGYWPAATLSRALATLDVLVHTRDVGASTRSTALAAALAHGLPIVAYRGVETTDVFIDGQNILLAPAGDPAALADRVAAVLVSPALRARLRAGARALYARLFAWERIGERFVEAVA